MRSNLATVLVASSCLIGIGAPFVGCGSAQNRVDTAEALLDSACGELARAMSEGTPTRAEDLAAQACHSKATRQLMQVLLVQGTPELAPLDPSVFGDAGAH